MNTQFHQISPKELATNPFQMIGADWMLVTAEKEGQANTMTASWGGLGVMWGRDVAYVVIRPQRYTKEFVDAADTFSLSFFDDSHKATLAYCGKVSGRDEDKIAKTGLTLLHHMGTPYFAEAKTVLIVKKLFVQTMTAESFLDASMLEHWYPAEDLHTMYIAQIETVLVRD